MSLSSLFPYTFTLWRNDSSVECMAFVDLISSCISFSGGNFQEYYSCVCKDPKISKRLRNMLPIHTNRRKYVFYKPAPSEMLTAPLPRRLGRQDFRLLISSPPQLCINRKASHTSATVSSMSEKYIWRCWGLRDAEWWMKRTLAREGIEDW